MHKDKLKEFTRKVDLILWRDWDPIGAGVPKDEYSSYALTIAGKAWRGESKKSMLDYLYWAENENIGLELTREQADMKNAPVVDRIIELAEQYK